MRPLRALATQGGVTRYRYDHPDGVGLGQHHAPHDLAARPAQPPEAAAALRQAAAVMSPTGKQAAALEAFLSRTMADLDMPPGTIVTLAVNDDPDSPDRGKPVRDDDNDLEIVEWADAHGDPRRTTVTPAFFAEHFTEVTG